MKSDIFRLQGLTPAQINKIIDYLKEGETGILPTDTIYGILGSALNKKTVEKIYRLRKRNKEKPMIILISSLKDLKLFNVKADERILKKFWPNPISIILPCTDKNFRYLHRGKNSLAFRLPDHPLLLRILKKTGPLVAPSANFEGEKSSETSEEAFNYFRNKTSFYLDAGRLQSKPSTIISLTDNNIEVIRQGVIKIK